MITPIGVTLADYIAAVKADEPTHIRITFSGQNVVLDDSDIDSSGIVVNDYLNGDTDLIMGKAVMKNIRIPIIRSSKLNGLIWNGEFKVEIGQEVNGITKWIVYGYFTGSRPEKINSVDVIEFTANDRMALFDRLAAPWIASLTYPKTVRQLFQSLCTFCGTGYYVGDELSSMANKTYYSFPYQHEGQTCREVLAQISEACGCYAKIMPNGNCKMVWYTDHTSDYTVTEADEFPPVEIYEYSEGKTWAELENYKWKDLENFRWCDLSGTKDLFKVDLLNIINTVRGDSVQYPSATSGNTYVIVDNPFIEYNTVSKINSYVKPIYERLAVFGGYLPLKVKCLGNALIESGDIVGVVVNGVTHNTPIFCKQFSWNGALVDYYEATGQINRAEVSVDTVKHISENTKYYNRQSGIDILPEGIKIEGSKYVKILSGGTFDVDSDNFKIDSVNKFVEIGNWNFNEIGLRYYRQSYDANTGYSGVLNGDPQGYISGIYFHDNYIDESSKNMSINLFTRVVDRSTNAVIYKDGWQFRANGSGRFIFSPDPYDGRSFATNFDLGTSAFPFDTLYIHKIDSDSYPIIIGNPNGPLGYLNIYDGGIYSHGDLSGYLGKSGCRFAGAYIYDVRYGQLNQDSSREVKHDIQDMPSEGDRLDKLHPVTFIYNDDKQNRKRYGLIYEETIDVMPEITTQDDNNKAINYVELIPILLKETQELRKRVSDLENRVAELEGRG